MSGVRIPPRPQPAQKGKDLSLWGYDRDSGPKAMELGCGSFVEMKWLSFYGLKKKINSAYFFCFTPRNSSSARLGQNSRASKSISSIAKMRSSSLICLLAVIVASRENR